MEQYPSDFVYNRYYVRGGRGVAELAGASGAARAMLAAAARLVSEVPNAGHTVEQGARRPAPDSVISIGDDVSNKVGGDGAGGPGEDGTTPRAAGAGAVGNGASAGVARRPPPVAVRSVGPVQ